MRQLLTTAMYATALLIPVTQPVSAQITNADYPVTVRSYMERPALTSFWRARSGVPARIVEVVSPDTLRAGEAGVFSVQTNLESAAVPLRATWSFGDGNEASGLVTEHVFDRPGTYQVRVTLRNPGGRTVKTVPVVVMPRSPDGMHE